MKIVVILLVLGLSFSFGGEVNESKQRESQHNQLKKVLEKERFSRELVIEDKNPYDAWAVILNHFIEADPEFISRVPVFTFIAQMPEGFTEYRSVVEQYQGRRRISIKFTPEHTLWDAFEFFLSSVAPSHWDLAEQRVVIKSWARDNVDE